MCGCVSGRKPVLNNPTSTFSSSGIGYRESVTSVAGNVENKEQMVTVQYIGPIAETFTIKSRLSRDISYRFGNNEFHSTRSVFLGDAEWLLTQADAQGNPTYIILGNVSTQEANDPAMFIGNSIVVDSN